METMSSWLLEELRCKLIYKTEQETLFGISVKFPALIIGCNRNFGACLHVLDLEALVAIFLCCCDADIKHFLQHLSLFQVLLLSEFS